MRILDLDLCKGLMRGTRKKIEREGGKKRKEKKKEKLNNLQIVVRKRSRSGSETMMTMTRTGLLAMEIVFLNKHPLFFLFSPCLHVYICFMSGWDVCVCVFSF